jgi:ribosomal protein S18 acetylase RimI-like enzyme
MTDTLTFRLANAKDIERIRALTLRAYEKWVSITPRKPRPMTADYNASFLINRFDLLLDNGVLVGLVETVRQGDELMIVNVAVEPTHQGRGLGRRLMAHAEALAQAASLLATRLYTNKLMIENIALYKKLGYQLEKETHHDLGTIAVHMVKHLNERRRST